MVFLEVFSGRNDGFERRKSGERVFFYGLGSLKIEFLAGSC